MILQRLYELADREKLIDDPSFVNKEVACRIDIDDSGNYLGIQDLRQSVEKPAKGKTPAKVIKSGGKLLPVPVRPVVRDAEGQWKTTDPAASGKEKPAVFLVDTIARVLPVNRLLDEDKREKFASQRATFWRFMKHVIGELKNNALEPIARFADKLLESTDLEDRICQDLDSLGLASTVLCTLALHSDSGKCLGERTEIISWWREFFGGDFATQQAGGRQGLCQVTGRVSGISQSVKTKVKGLVPIGCRADAYLVTGLDSADSFNLVGAEASMVSPEGIDGFTRALNALIGNDFPSQRTSYRVNGIMVLFWTREKHDHSMMTLFDPEPDQVRFLLESASRGVQSSQASSDAFYMLTLGGNSARVVVRDYLETTVDRIHLNLAAWFKELTIADLSKEGNGYSSSRVPLWMLANATAMDSDGVAPDTPARLLQAAIQRTPISDSILNACLRRLRADGASGFYLARMSLIKLYLLRKGLPVTETLDPSENDPAYIYGRLLSIFEQIQYDALGDVNANVVDKFYATFSASPGLVFSRLFANAQNHLRKLKSEKPGAAVNSERLLSEVVTMLNASPPSMRLSLQDQGRFAIGYYHQKAKRFQDIAESKAKKAAS